MVRRPPVQYAPSPGGQIAFCVVGEGPRDLLLVSTGAWNLDLMWEQHRLTDFIQGLATFSRVAVFQPRGYCMSDAFPLTAPPSVEEWAADTKYVMDAAGFERASILAVADTAPFALLAAATFPSRVDRLVLIDGMARMSRVDGYAIGPDADELRLLNAHLETLWGTGGVMALLVPDLAGDAAFLDWAARSERGTASPSMFAFIRSLAPSTDVRGVLPAVHAPTLVVSHAKNTVFTPEHSRYLADHLPAAEYVERPGACGLPWFHDAEWTLDAVETFLTGKRSARDDLEDRVLATVLFTDIVASTTRAAAIGDTRWRALLEQHDSIVREELARYRGEFVASTGDGVLATFDGPARAIRCALSLSQAIRTLGLEIRAGLHTGEVIRAGGDVRGIAVAIGARVMAEAGPGEVFVSGSIPPLVAGSGLEFSDLGVRLLKGVPGEWRLHAVVP